MDKGTNCSLNFLCVILQQKERNVENKKKLSVCCWIEVVGGHNNLTRMRVVVFAKSFLVYLFMAVTNQPLLLVESTNIYKDLNQKRVSQCNTVTPLHPSKYVKLSKYLIDNVI